MIVVAVASYSLCSRVLGEAVQALLALAADAAQVDLASRLGGGLAQARGGAGARGNVRGHIAARPDVDVARVGRLPVRGNGGLLGEGQVGLSLGDLIGLGLSHF